jgi:peptidoglycan/LPS O-acetylase OafA/YrhL
MRLYSEQFSNDVPHLAVLDGFRACLALWVYLGHLSYAVGLHTYLLIMHPLAVDLFMVLSGFLMVLTWRTDLQSNRYFSRTTLNFYIVRFFRIAPLYFFILLCCYFGLTQLAHMRDQVLMQFPPPWVLDASAFKPVTEWHFDSFKWFFLHLTFLYGAIPGGETTPLPDWSLSLEMQFYLVLPLLLSVLRQRFAIVACAIAFSALAFITPKLLGSYLEPGVYAHFGQPSFLTYRLNAFLAGMIPAFWMRQQKLNLSNNYSKTMLVSAAALCLLPLTKPVIVIYGLFVLLLFRRVWLVTWLLSWRPLRFLGDISYSIYLSHLLVVIPLVYVLIRSQLFLGLNPWLRLGVTFLFSAPVVFIVSYLLWRFIELPSIQLGRWILKKYATTTQIVR